MEANPCHPTGDDLHGIEIELEIVKASTAPAGNP